LAEDIIKNTIDRLREKIVRSTKVVCDRKEGQLVGIVKMDDSVVTAVHEAVDELKRLTT
jgi:uncharacterized protein GlcG (DUF336 family)